VVLDIQEEDNFILPTNKKIKMKNKLIAPLAFYIVHPLLSIILGTYFVFTTQIDFRISKWFFLAIPYLALLNYISTFRPLIIGDLEYNCIITFEFMLQLNFIIHKDYFGFFIFSILNSIVIEQVFKREWQKIFLNVSYFLTASFFLLLFYRLVDITEASSLFHFTLIGILNLFYSYTIEMLITGGYFAKEKNQSVLYSIYDFLGLYTDFMIFSSLAFPFYYVLSNYSAFLIIPILILSAVVYKVIESHFALDSAEKESLELLTKILESKDPYTAGHSLRVAKYSMYAGIKLKLSPWRLKRLYNAALLHDIGKLVVPSQILNKPGKLTDKEFRRMKKHEEATSQLLIMIDFLRPVATFTKVDNEKTIEKLPNNIAKLLGEINKKENEKNKKINESIEAEIIYVSDAYDAMTSSRSYRKALLQEVAFEELRKCSGPDKQFSNLAVEALITSIENKNEKHGLGYEEENFHEDAPVVGTGSAGIGDLETSKKKEVSDVD
jgi:hypothetical protein